MIFNNRTAPDVISDAISLMTPAEIVREIDPETKVPKTALLTTPLQAIPFEVQERKPDSTNCIPFFDYLFAIEVSSFGSKLGRESHSGRAEFGGDFETRCGSWWCQVLRRLYTGIITELGMHHREHSASRTL